MKKPTWDSDDFKEAFDEWFAEKFVKPQKVGKDEKPPLILGMAVQVLSTRGPTIEWWNQGEGGDMEALENAVMYCANRIHGRRISMLEDEARRMGFKLVKIDD